MFWKRWFKQDRKQLENSRESSCIPSQAATAVMDTPDPLHHAQMAERRHSRDKATWFTKAEIAALKNVDSEKQLSQIISRKVPDASREEVLFRYYLSRAIYIGEFELPILPQSVAQVMNLSRDPKAEIKDYVRVIESDHSLVRAIIEVANSSFFASLSDYSSLDQAIIRIGLRQVDQITLVHALRSKVFRVRGFEDLTSSITGHSTIAATASRVVAEHLAGASEGDAFLGGLFHDVGKLILLGLVGEVQRKLSWQAGPRLVESAFETYHVFLGEIVCSHWKFPEDLARALGAHHEPERARLHPLDASVYLGNLLAHSIEVSGTEAVCEADDPVLTGSSLDPRSLLTLREEAIDRLDAYEALD